MFSLFRSSKRLTVTATETHLSDWVMLLGVQKEIRTLRMLGPLYTDSKFICRNYG